jgi:hypothetical protein|tara:strand:- start:743 stop:958 length:216 start_codon:yes stop_codon:yes gene_type:complete
MKADRQKIGNLVQLNFASEAMGFVISVEEFCPGVQRVKVLWFRPPYGDIEGTEDMETWTSPSDIHTLSLAK